VVHAGCFELYGYSSGGGDDAVIPVYSISSFIDPLLTKLLAAEDRRMGNILSKMNTKNKRLNDTKIDGFIHRGIYYIPKDAVWIRVAKQSKTALHLSLIGEMESFLKDRQRVEDDRKLISQVLFNLLSPCRSNQDIRNALPNCLVSVMPELAKLPRTDSEAYTLQDNPRALRQYEMALLKMEVFVATQLLY
jgi:hypothetical protein